MDNVAIAGTAHPLAAVGAAQAITLFGRDYTVDAELVAEKLGLPVDAFWREIKRGLVYSVVERGEGEDAGRVRLTFRCRSRSCTVIVDGIVDRA